MKYIRTKDRIYETDYHNDEQGYYITTDYCCFKDNEIKVANTIEELCDLFIVHMLGTKCDNPAIFKDFSNVCEFANSLFGKNHIVAVYGAIWTSKGLIYVAKMNEKGVLELL